MCIVEVHWHNKWGPRASGPTPRASGPSCTACTVGLQRSRYRLCGTAELSGRDRGWIRWREVGLGGPSGFGRPTDLEVPDEDETFSRPEDEKLVLELSRRKEARGSS